MTARPRFRADWLLSLTPTLARFEAEDRARALLHDAHVNAWMDDVPGAEEREIAARVAEEKSR